MPTNRLTPKLDQQQHFSWRRVSAFVFVLVVLNISLASARDFHVVPGAGGGTGGVTTPWKGLQAALQNGPFNAGDRLLLGDGYFGDLSLKNLANKGMVTIAPAKDSSPKISGISVSASTNWRIEGLQVSPSFAPKYRKKNIVSIGGDSRDIVLDRLAVFSLSDGISWGAKDWSKRASDGIWILGQKVTVTNNRIWNVSTGITVFGQYSIVKGNVIERFSGDGIRGLASHAVFDSNVVKNCLSVDGNHDDGFQSWTEGPNGIPGKGTISDVAVTRNTFIGAEFADGKFKCDMQGIGMFDGMYEDWLIENNLIVVDHYHGITVMGANNVRIINNTVVDPNNVKPGPAAISIYPHKGASAVTSGNVIANNFASHYGPRQKGVVYKSNLVARFPKSIFMDPGKFDFRLLPDSRGIDKADPTFAPDTDINGNARPAGRANDVGAYEFSENPS